MCLPTISLVEKLAVPIPLELRVWGIENYDVLRKIYRYVLHKGEQARAKNM